MTGLFSSLSADAGDPGTVLAAGNGTLFVSHDGGDTFSVLPGGFDNPCGASPAFTADRGRLWVFGGGSGCWTRLR